MKNNLLIFLLFVMVFLSGCVYQESSIKNSPQAKEELQQFLQKVPSLGVLDIAYSLQVSILNKNITDITFRQIKKGNQQRQDSHGNMLGFNLNATSIIKEGQQVTCAVFDNEWKCSYGDEVCIEKDKVKQCQSVSHEGIPPTIKPELLKKTEVAYASSRQIIGMDVKCYILSGTENGRKVSMEACLNQDGLIFSMSTKAKGFQATIEAKSFSITVEPDSFSLPAKIS